MLLHLVRRVYPDALAVFVDTGLEYPELRDFVRTIPNVVWLRPKMNFRKVIEKYGYPIISKEISKKIKDGKMALEKGNKDSYALAQLNGTYTTKNGKKSLFPCTKYKYLLDAPFKVSNQCCDIMKKRPIKKFAKEHQLNPILGTMANESGLRMQHWQEHGCNAFNKNEPSSQPLSFWTEQDILEYINRYNIPYASVYGEILQDESGKFYTTGCQRTGCVFCGFGCHLEKEPNRFQKLKITHPKLWNYCMKPWSEGGLGMKEVLEFINVPIE